LTGRRLCVINHLINHANAAPVSGGRVGAAKAGVIRRGMTTGTKS